MLIAKIISSHASGFCSIRDCVLHSNRRAPFLAAAGFSMTDGGFSDEAAIMKQMHIWELLEKTQSYRLVCHLCQSA